MGRWGPVIALVFAACAPFGRTPAASKPAGAEAKPSAPIGTRSATASQAPSLSAAVDPGAPADGSELEAVHDEVELDASLPGPVAAPPREHPLDDVDPPALERMLRDDPAALGSVTLGQPSAGALLNAVQMPRGDRWVLVDPAHAWGTQETIDYLVAAIEAVHAELPAAHPLYIGHISARHGGALSPHVSHQAGRDVDISYFYEDEKSARWYARAHAGNLDRARTWSFVRALVTLSDVELILIDHSLQTLLREHALAIGEDPEWVESLFRGKPGKLRPLIVHARGHATHLHVRFYNPIAQETAHRTFELLVARGLVKPPTLFVKHRVKKGETLGMLARKYKSTVPAIKSANGLRSNLIRAGHEYRIPKRGGTAAPRAAVIPERRLPPSFGSRSGSAGAARSGAR
jgi:murein endopeptidase